MKRSIKILLEKHLGMPTRNGFSADPTSPIQPRNLFASDNYTRGEIFKCRESGERGSTTNQIPVKSPWTTYAPEDNTTFNVRVAHSKTVFFSYLWSVLYAFHLNFKESLLCLKNAHDVDIPLSVIEDII